MEVLYPRCCGLDVHKSSVSACVLMREGARTHKKYARFGAMTRFRGRRPVSDGMRYAPKLSTRSKRKR